LQTASIEVVTPTEGDHAPLAEKAVKLELFEWLLSQVANEILLFVRRDQCRFATHAGGRFICAFEKGLSASSTDPDWDVYIGCELKLGADAKHSPVWRIQFRPIWSPDKRLCRCRLQVARAFPKFDANWNVAQSKP
jgi:hypothetical protein